VITKLPLFFSVGSASPVPGSIISGRMVFVNVQQILTFAFRGDSGPDNLGETVDVEAFRWSFSSISYAHVLAPWLSAERTAPQ